MKLLLVVIPQLATVFSGKKIFTSVWTTLQLYYFVFSRKLKTINSEFKLTILLNGKQHALHLLRPMDLASFREAFVDLEYAWQRFDDLKPASILDLGAHIGDTALYYHSRFPDATIYAVEASAAVFERLKKNVAGIKQIIPIHAAAGGFDGEVDFHVNKNSLGSSLLSRGDNEHTEKVPVRTIMSLCDEYGLDTFDLIKFDIEGGEFELFRAEGSLDRSSYFIGELHFDLVPEDKETFLRRFADFEVSMEPLQGEGRYMFKASRKV